MAVPPLNAAASTVAVFNANGMLSQLQTPQIPPQPGSRMPGGPPFVVNSNPTDDRLNVFGQYSGPTDPGGSMVFKLVPEGDSIRIVFGEDPKYGSFIGTTPAAQAIKAQIGMGNWVERQ